MGYVDYNLTWSQLALIGTAGLMRQINGIRRSREPNYKIGNLLNWQIHIEGCMGEFCVAKFLNRFWCGKLGDVSPGDVGPVEVRTAGATITEYDLPRVHKRRLCCHKDDLNDKPFVHVTGINGQYRLHGWLYGREVKLDEYWKDPTGADRPAYYAPNNKLRSLESLKMMVDNGDFEKPLGEKKSFQGC